MNAQILEHPTLAHQRQRKGMATALELTEEMLVMAQAGQWQQVKQLEKKRRDHIDRCLSRPVEAGDMELFSDALGALLTLNDRLVSVVQDTKATYRQNHLNTRKTVSLASKYLDID